MKFSKTWVAAAAILISSTAHADLNSQGDGTVLDTNTHLIWLENWNANLYKDWSTQKAWAEGLTFAGSSDWRLPSVSEFNALFGAYGDISYRGEFTDVQYSYWSATETDPNSVAIFLAYYGNYQGAPKGALIAATAVRDVSAVPEPQTYALMLLGVGALVAVARRRSL